MKFFRWIAALIVTVVVVAFAVANRQPLAVRFDPLPFSLELPVYVMVLGILLVGFALGVLFQWLIGQKWRRLARTRHRRIAALEEELSGLRRQLEERSGRPEDVSAHLPPPGAAA